MQQVQCVIKSSNICYIFNLLIIKKILQKYAMYFINEVKKMQISYADSIGDFSDFPKS